MKKIGLLTHKDFFTYPSPLPDEETFAYRLREKGYSVDCPAWDDTEVEWASYDLVLFRTCWNYMDNPEAFSQWLQAREADRTRLFNPAETIRWNMDKNYLLAWRTRGFKVAPIIEAPAASADEALPAIMDANGWDEIVVKPQIGAGSKGLLKFSRKSAATASRYFEAATAIGGLLAQAFYRDVMEIGLVFFDRNYTHALRKHPTVWESVADGVARPKTSPDTEAYTPTRYEIEAAQSYIDATPDDLLYGRIDGFMVDNEFYLTELEYFEPELYLRFDTEGRALSAFMEAVEKRL